LELYPIEVNITHFERKIDILQGGCFSKPDVTHVYRKWDFSPTKSQNLIVITIEVNKWD